MKRGTKIAAVAGAAILLILLVIGILELREQSTERNRKTFQESFGFEPPERNNAEQIAELQLKVDMSLSILRIGLLEALFARSRIEAAKNFCEALQAKLPMMINEEMRRACASAEQRLTEATRAAKELETAMNKAVHAAKHYGFEVD